MNICNGEYNLCGCQDFIFIFFKVFYDFWEWMSPQEQMTRIKYSGVPFRDFEFFFIFGDLYHINPILFFRNRKLKRDYINRNFWISD